MMRAALRARARQQPPTPLARDRRVSTLILLRHGQSVWNGSDARFTGWCDVPLTVRGRVEAVGAGQLLRSRGFPARRVDVAFTSDEPRGDRTETSLRRRGAAAMARRWRVAFAVTRARTRRPGRGSRVGRGRDRSRVGRGRAPPRVAGRSSSARTRRASWRWRRWRATSRRRGTRSAFGETCGSTNDTTASLRVGNQPSRCLQHVCSTCAAWSGRVAKRVAAASFSPRRRGAGVFLNMLPRRRSARGVATPPTTPPRRRRRRAAAQAASRAGSSRTRSSSRASGRICCCRGGGRCTRRRRR